MAIKYDLIQSKDMSENAAEDAKLWYARAATADHMTFDELCDYIAESSTVTTADVKAVLDRMAWAISKNLQAGRIIEMGELGNFRMTIGSSGVKDKEDFTASLIKKPRIKFHAGKRLQQARTGVKFQCISAQPVTGGEEDDEQQGIPNP